MNIIKILNLYFDDILFVLGTICVCVAGFLVNRSIGWGLAGICLIIYALLIAKGNKHK